MEQIRELTRLVADATSGDKLTFFCASLLPAEWGSLNHRTDSGHSDQQKSFDDISIEEDGQDEGKLLSCLTYYCIFLTLDE